MMKSKFIITVIVLLSASSLRLSAQDRSLRDENARIHQGVRTGELTRSEKARLKTQERQLHREAIRFKANDGHISPRERRELRRDNERLSRNIYRQKHDRQKRF